MPKLKTLSGDDVIKVLGRFGFLVVSQRGSHVKLQREGSGGSKQTLIIPRHAELDRGTLGAIYRQALRYLPEDKLQPQLFD
ncbi:hypothetical protein COU12_01905 [Candidatus Jorgensenbacteria bacterium CG10_big_fil_rev_8_21_14_0_10_54_38]|uniref:Type II toxin-antitoxin system HicA family toxin n=2 Tax=Candidatus Joergenseniibacteriota TaxID=1752739 RepID=A0A2M6WFV8_9BACT|nr:MAG: hypothetical protein COX26_02720 [Candidatus Jorgensenbacteria bacterium CG23_combo_of_CG06-09_8_20_14_all_54_14]PIT91656.1 MAG: hypothetical protein COU12_01905 [Candidatus Jorgensenbacteria bacterium CG10_big_fil_rev_8_21_14_0_10_54_38]